MPFNFHNQGRMENLIEELEGMRYRKLHEIESFDWYDDNGENGNRAPVGEPEKVSVGFRWSGWDRYNWLCTKITIPEDMKDEDVVGLFDFGVPMGTGNNSHFESLLYVNGKAYQGVDGNHKEVFFNIAETGRELELKFMVWSGLNGGGRPKDMEMKLVRAQFGVLDKETDDFYFLARTALDTYELLEEKSEHKEWLLNQLVASFNLVDYTEPESDTFYDSIKKAYAYLNQQMDGRGKPDVLVNMVGHTHIDVAWLWRLCHTREKAARSFSTVNRLMERYGDYVFLQSQAQLYEYIKEDYPEIYEHIKKRVKEGRWEPSGAMWVECDCNVASGESIIRQILVGKNFFRQEFDYDSKFLWLPDVFGYSWAIPQILKKSGVDTFMTTKISWNDTNRLPYDTFLWKGLDGTAVTTHFVTTSDKGETYYTYNGNSRPYAVQGVWDNYRNKDLNRELLISYGYGDGGGGPTRDMIKSIEAVEKMPGIPHVKTGTATKFFDTLNDTIKENPYGAFLPVWDGELYLEFHRGTYTSQAYNKKMNRKMEYRLREQELLSVLAMKTKGIPYAYDELLKAWKIVLCHQFHDILPGSSIHEVYEDSRVEYEKAAALLDSVAKAAEEALYQEKPGVYTVFNTGNWKRDTCGKLPSSKGTRVYTDKEGNALTVSYLEDADYVYVNGMEPFSFAEIHVKEGKEEEKAIIMEELGDGILSTPFYEMTIDQRGHITRLFDKEANREVIPEGKSANVLQLFEDKPRCFDAWELEPTIDNKKEELGNCEKISIHKDKGGIFVTFKWNYHLSTITQRMCLYNGKRRIDFKTNIDWQEHQKLMKVAFPVNIRGVYARYDIQEGNIVRPITRNTTWEAAKFEVAAHKWADLSETGYGVALLNDCKYGYDIKEDTMRLTLLKSAIDPDYSADTGTHEFTYSLLPHQEEWYAAGIEEEAFDLNCPLTAKEGIYTGGVNGLFKFSEDNIVVDAVKKAENGEDIILRFHEFYGARKEITLTSALAVTKWCEGNLMEEPEGEWKEGEMTLSVSSYEIKTILLKIK